MTTAVDHGTGDHEVVRQIKSFDGDAGYRIGYGTGLLLAAWAEQPRGIRVAEDQLVTAEEPADSNKVPASADTARSGLRLAIIILLAAIIATSLLRKHATR